MIIALVIFPVILALGGFLIYQSIHGEKLAKKELAEREKELKKKAYEAEILRELGERFGYELNEEKIIDIITSSIGQLFSYSTVSSVLLLEEKNILKIHLKESVNQKFINTMKESMLASVEALGYSQIRENPVEELITGTVVESQDTREIGSYFNVPIVISDRLAGLMNIASTVPGLYQVGETTILYRIVNQASTAVSKLHHVLETEKGKLSSMLYSMADGVVMVDQKSELTIINPSAKKMLSIKEENPTMFDLVDALGGKLNLPRKIDEIVKKGEPLSIKELVLSESAVQVLLSPVKDKKDRLIGVVMVLHDISKEKELERLREDFTAMMIHELRAPLTAVRGASSSLLSHKEGFPEDKKQEYLNMIKESSENMLAIVNDLLDVAKIEVGKMTIDLKTADIGKLVKVKTEAFVPLAQEKSLDLKAEVPDQPVEVEIDTDRIGQVLSNLLSNAIKFTEQGSIIVSLEAGDTEVKVWVKDTGVGIKPEDQSRLFSKFAQLGTKKPRTAEGTGLGLVVARGIVEAHAGRIWVDSEEGKGSTFYFTIPLKKA